MKRFDKLAVAAIGLALGLGATAAYAQTAASATNFPDRPITIVVPYTPGGSVDTVARIVSAQLQKALGQPIVIDNRPGASGMIGASHVARSKPDGYTLLLHASSHVYLPLVNPKATYNATNDFTPIARIGTVPLLIVAAANAPFNNLLEMKALAQKNRDTKEPLTWATSGYGTSSHLVEEMLNRDLDLGMQIIAYKGAAPQLNDVVAGHVSAAASPMPGAFPFVSSGRLKALAVTTANRVSKLPDVPTVAESGVPGFDFSSWYGVWGPAGMPAEVVKKIAAGIAQAMKTPEVKTAFDNLMFEIVESSPEDLAKVQAAEQEKIGQLAKQANIVVQ